MTGVVQLLVRYKSVHLNPINVKAHFVGIPLILWSLLVWLALAHLDVAGWQFRVAMLLTPMLLGYYLWLSARLAIGMLVLLLPLLYSATLVAASPVAVWIAAMAFGIGWVIQLVGHKYERAKPAFMDDVSQLLIGPLFLVAEVCFALGLWRSLDATIRLRAIERRRQLDAKQIARDRVTW